MKALLFLAAVLLSTTASASAGSEITFSKIHSVVFKHQTVSYVLKKAGLDQTDLSKISVKLADQDIFPGTENSTKIPRFYHTVTTTYVSSANECQFTATVVSADLFAGQTLASVPDITFTCKNEIFGR